MHRKESLMQIQLSLTIEVYATASLTQMEEQIQRAGHNWMRQALKETVRAWEQSHRRCPGCESQAVRTEGTVRRRLLALFGPVDLPLRRYRCQVCRQRFCPAL